MMHLHRLAQADWNHVCNDGLPDDAIHAVEAASREPKA